MLDGIVGGELVSRLRTLKGHLADERHLAQAFRQAEQLLPHLQSEAPNLVPILGNCFFWAIIDHGFPEDLQRYIKVFGARSRIPIWTAWKR